MPRDEPVVEIVNTVASAKLRHEIDLNALTHSFPEAEYRPEEFPGLIFHLKKPKTATLIFHSGKMVCTGASSERDARRALKRVVKRLKKSGMIIVGKLEMKIVNVVASVSLGGKVDLVGFYESCGREMAGRIMYEPEQFPGLIYRMNDPKAVILIFSSGKVVCTGAVTERDVGRAVEKLRERLEEDDLITYADGGIKE